MLIGPVHRLTRIRGIQWLRQPLGIAGWTWVVTHLIGYFFFHQSIFAVALADIALKPFLWMAAVSFVILTALAATSWQGAMSWLKARWKKLHALSMGAVVLGGMHGLMAQKVALNEFGLITLVVLLIALWRWVETMRRTR